MQHQRIPTSLEGPGTTTGTKTCVATVPTNTIDKAQVPSPARTFETLVALSGLAAVLTSVAQVIRLDVASEPTMTLGTSQGQHSTPSPRGAHPSWFSRKWEFENLAAQWHTIRLDRRVLDMVSNSYCIKCTSACSCV